MKQRAYVQIRLSLKNQKQEVSCAYELAILGNEPSQAFLI